MLQCWLLLRQFGLLPGRSVLSGRYGCKLLRRRQFLLCYRTGLLCRARPGDRRLLRKVSPIQVFTCEWLGPCLYVADVMELGFSCADLAKTGNLQHRTKVGNVDLLSMPLTDKMGDQVVQAAVSPAEVEGEKASPGPQDPSHLGETALLYVIR